MTFEYHGIARSELEASKRIARATGVSEHRLVRLPDLRDAGDIRAAAFAGMPSTYIPMRNGIFYSLAASYAEEVGAHIIVGGHNKDDSKTFADAAPAFFDQLCKAFLVGSSALRKRRTRILLPLSGRTKAQVVRLASSLDVPLGLTWSCHRDGKSHCWDCAGCHSRIAAFEKAGISDPLRSPDRAAKIS